MMKLLKNLKSEEDSYTGIVNGVYYLKIATESANFNLHIRL